ncbi:hypothetical protein CANINC_003849 [Pichia inconspicua]|uniref:Glycosyltransferase family 71 protein n=1 Tax=Pichia inconspicua TaxID=52247 RepID=A0A4T0WXY4_9ASCO|nr:hypothetical protein CANINC_003849 [[Candida] inconspicua]
MPKYSIEEKARMKSNRMKSQNLLKIGSNMDSGIVIPEPIEDSLYAQDEMSPHYQLNEKDQLEILKEIDNFKQLKQEKGRENPNPPKPYKNWRINVDKDLNKVTSKEFTNGHDITRGFFDQLLNLIYENRLSFPLEQRMKMENGKTVIDPVVFFAQPDDNLSERQCEGLFHFPKDFVADATVKHKIITDNLPNVIPNFYNNNGYVIVGGGKYSWFALLAIEVLRQLGSKLPVEVVIPTIDDYDELFCNSVLKKYNARCINLFDVFDPKLLSNIGVTGYQYKSLALLASSFENAFLMDSDNYPVTNPDVLFDSDLFLQNTMITWPDYWRRTTSPSFYDITGRKIGKRVRYLNDEHTDPKYYKLRTEDNDPKLMKIKVPFHDRDGTIPDWTTESGQMLINKKIHFKALLLALYYNLQGQFAFYPLLSQGGAGEGDKETFVAASHFFGLNFYQVHKKPDRAYGFYKWRNDFFDTSIIQYNPIKDYEILQRVNREINEAIENDADSFKYNHQTMFIDKFSIEASEPMFYHVHETKMDPYKLYKIAATFDLEGKKIRNLGGDFPRFKFDLEQFLWKTVDKHICKMKTNIAFIVDDKMQSQWAGICAEFMENQLKFLKESEKVIIEKYKWDDPYANLERCQNLYEL